MAHASRPRRLAGLEDRLTLALLIAVAAGLLWSERIWRIDLPAWVPSTLR